MRVGEAMGTPPTSYPSTPGFNDIYIRKNNYPSAAGEGERIFKHSELAPADTAFSRKHELFTKLSPPPPSLLMGSLTEHFYLNMNYVLFAIDRAIERGGGGEHPSLAGSKTYRYTFYSSITK